MPPTRMHLKILLPFQLFADEPAVLRIVAETREGAFGLLPQRLDCVAALTPGILIYETVSGGETIMAVDEGVLVKTGPEVLVSVRRAMGGADLGEMRKSVETEFAVLSDHEQDARAVMTRLEMGFLRRMANLSA